MTYIKSSLKYIKGSSSKLNDVAGLIRGCDIMHAEEQLQCCNKRISGIVKKVLSSAIANAVHNNKIDKSSLVVDRVEVGQAFMLKRSLSCGRGRIGRIKKRYSNLEIVLCDNNMVSSGIKKNKYNK